MRRRRAGTMLACLCTVLGATANTPAGAAVGGGGMLDPDPGGETTMTVDLTVAYPGTDGAYTSGSDSPSPVRYVAIPAARGEGLSIEFLCSAESADLAPGEIPWGWRYTIIATETATGREVSRRWVCVPLADPASPTIPPAPPVPTPPDIFEIWNSVGLPTPDLHTNPTGEGVTGLATWIWTGGPTTATVDASIGEFTVTGTAHLIAWNIDPGDGTTTHDTSVPGDPEHHALDHTYEVKGTYPLSVTAVWVAEVALSGPALPPTPVPIGAAQITASRRYRVVEVVAVLLP